MELLLSQVEKDLFEVSQTSLGNYNFFKEKCEPLCFIADDRSIAIKKLIKVCVVVWDRYYYIGEAKIDLDKKNVYKNEKMLQDLAETSKNIFKKLYG